MNSSEQHQDVVVAVIKQNGRYLTCRRAPDDRFPDLWEFPGGKVDPDETHHDALAREILEELGVKVLSISKTHIGSHHLRFAVINYRMYFYEVRLEPLQVIQQNVHSDSLFLPLSVLIGMTNLTPGTLSCAGILNAQAN